MVVCVLWQFPETTMDGQTRRSIQTHFSDNDPTSICSYSLINTARLEKKQQIYSIFLVRHRRRSNTHSTSFEAITQTITPTMRYTA